MASLLRGLSLKGVGNMVVRGHRVIVQDPPLARLLFSDTRMSIIWLVARLALGWQWLDFGWRKVTDPAWMETGTALQSFWQRAVAVPEQGRPPVVFDWYRSFLQALLEGGHHTWFAKLVALGETAVGVALILGAFTGLAAFFGLFMNWHYVMVAGAAGGGAGFNAPMAAVGILLVLAWKNGGWLGLDRWFLPWLGTPWQPWTHAEPPPPSEEPARDVDAWPGQTGHRA